MIVLGIADGQTSGACVIADGKILSAINEERIVRMKQARGFPWESITAALDLAGVSAKDIDAVAVAGARMHLREKVAEWPGWFEAREEGRSMKDQFFKIAARLGGLVPYIPGAQAAYYGMRTPVYLQRRRRIPEILRNEFGINCPTKYFHHHYCHATSAYYTSGFDDALVVTMDGGGDGHCAHVYSVRGGKFKKLATISSYDSLGNYYAYVTALCGYKAKRHEGKITGLAAHGQPIYRDMLNSLISCENGRLHNRGKVLFTTALDRIKSLLPEDWTHEDLAASIQVLSEDISRELVAHWLKVTGHKNVALAGGVFANVRINEEILHLPGVENLFVHPGMGDEGLFVGAAFALEQQALRRDGKPYEPLSLPTVYLGSDIHEKDAEQALRDSQLEFHRPNNMPQYVAEKLAEGKIVARTVGRMEYGPRALGNRTIMYQPNDASANDWLNTMLDRTEFMPFAPASLEEETEKLYVDYDSARDTARFMTTTFHCTDWMRENCSGVVHIDNTARPQLVREEDNPEYYATIKHYHQLTGIPVVVNTSFNMHEEPIVRTAQEGVRAFLDSNIDNLQLGPFIAKGPVGSGVVRAQHNSDN